MVKPVTLCVSLLACCAPPLVIQGCGEVAGQAPHSKRIPAPCSAWRAGGYPVKPPVQGSSCSGQHWTQCLFSGRMGTIGAHDISRSTRERDWITARQRSRKVECIIMMWIVRLWYIRAKGWTANG